MAIKNVNPYLHFNGDAESAIAFYQRVLGAELEGPVMRFSQIPGNTPAPEHANRVIHACLKLGGGQIMISDNGPNMPFSAEGTNHQVALHFDTPAALNAAFAAMAEGGKVSMEPHDAFWGARFGMLTDKFGIKFMFNCEATR